MRYLATTDVGQSIRKAFSDYTHILVNRGYTTIKPVFFKSASIADLPVYVWAWWDSDASPKRQGGICKLRQ
ncbi:hypothetical protein WT24_23540 [Burkholderia sp. MSMB1078WGS]|nr:hypothetical protein WT24_23540 [Burkholderia sp. MSMB1078WGS]